MHNRLFKSRATIASDTKRAYDPARRTLRVIPRTLLAGESSTRTQSRYRSILVPLDGSTFAEHAIPYAVGLAEQLSATLRLVHVHNIFETMEDFQPLYVDDSTLRTLKQEKQNYLTDIVRRISKESSTPAFASVIAGQDVVDALRDVDFLGTDLVVMATHARGVIGRFLFGDVVRRVLRHAEVPVMVVRGDRTNPSVAAKTIRRMLIPVDGTSAAEQALTTAATFGSIVGAKQTLMQVLHLEPNVVVRDGARGTDWVASRHRVIQALRYLRRLKKSLPIPKEAVQTKVISGDGHTGDAIRSFAERSAADLIALTAPKRGILSRVVRESTAHHLIRNARTPILFVPSVATTESHRRTGQCLESHEMTRCKQPRPVGPSRI